MYPEHIKRFSGALLLPQPIAIHKPRSDGQGSALKLNVRYSFEFGTSPDSDVQYLKRSRGGLFVDLAQQARHPDGAVKRDANGNAQFDWANRATLVSAKLGVPDLSALLVGYREVRELGQPVPPELRMPARAQDTEEQQQRKAFGVSLTHKPATAGSEAAGTTIITYQFTGTGGTLRISRSREHAAQVSLTLAEEYRVFRYFELALDTALRLGGR